MNTLLKSAQEMSGTPYKYGGKGEGGIDCSGLVCHVVSKATGGKLRLPQGSAQQMETLKRAGYKAQPYKAVGGKQDNLLRINFLKATDNQPGHAWLTVNGQTIESWGGHGPGTRNWDAHSLLARPGYSFTLAGPQ